MEGIEITIRDYAGRHRKTVRVIRLWIKRHPEWAETSGVKLINAPRPYYVIRADAAPLELRRGRPRKLDSLTNHSPAGRRNLPGIEWGKRGKSE